MLKDKKLFLYDIDGTIAIDHDLIDGTKELLTRVEENGGTNIFITNNSTKSRKDYVKKFREMGLFYDESHFITASVAAVSYLKDHFDGQKLFVVGTRSFREELAEQGFLVTEKPDDGAVAALVGYDSELTYEKIRNLCELLYRRPDLPYFATNPDLNCPSTFGAVPDCGAICQMIACAVKKMPVVLGKPNSVMIDLSRKQAGCSKEETLVIGDRLYTDIASGIHAGVETALVFTGEAGPEDLSDTEFMPDFTFPSVKELKEALFGDVR